MIREQKSTEILQDMEGFLRQQRPFEEYAGGKDEARDVVSTILRVCSAKANSTLAKRVFTQSLAEGHSSTATCNLYLGCLVSPEASGFHLDEAQSVIAAMRQRNYALDSHTYQALLEMHYRLGYDVKGIWEEMGEKGVEPTLLSLRTVLGPAIVGHPDPTFVINVTRLMIERRATERMNLVDTLHGLATNEGAAPDQCVWLLFEIEQMCVLEKVSIKDALGPSNVILMCFVKCARRGDSDSAEMLLGLLERHHFPKGPDLYGLMVYAYSVAGKWREAFDLLQDMAQRGLLESQDAHKKFFIEPLRMSMERHYLMALVMMLSIAAESVDKAYYYLEARRSEGNNVSVHCLDVIVLACAKLFDEQRAIETIESYEKFDVKPRATSYLYLLQACGGKNKARHQRTIFEAMLRNEVEPTAAIYKLLIRQGVLADNMDDALEFLERMARTIRVESEVIEGIIDKAVKVGDVELVRSLIVRCHQEWTLYLDPTYLSKVSAQLSRVGVDASPLMPGIALHEEARNLSGNATAPPTSKKQ